MTGTSLATLADRMFNESVDGITLPTIERIDSRAHSSRKFTVSNTTIGNYVVDQRLDRTTTRLEELALTADETTAGQDDPVLYWPNSRLGKKVRSVSPISNVF